MRTNAGLHRSIYGRLEQLQKLTKCAPSGGDSPPAVSTSRWRDSARPTSDPPTYLPEGYGDLIESTRVITLAVARAAKRLEPQEPWR